MYLEKEIVSLSLPGTTLLKSEKNILLAHLLFIYLSIYLKLTMINKILYTKIHIK